MIHQALGVGRWALGTGRWALGVRRSGRSRRPCVNQECVVTFVIVVIVDVYLRISLARTPLTAPAIIRLTAAIDSPPSSVAGIVAKPIAEAVG